MYSAMPVGNNESLVMNSSEAGNSSGKLEPLAITNARSLPTDFGLRSSFKNIQEIIIQLQLTVVAAA